MTVRMNSQIVQSLDYHIKRVVFLPESAALLSQPESNLLLAMPQWPFFSRRVLDKFRTE